MTIFPPLIMSSNSSFRRILHNSFSFTGSYIFRRILHWWFSHANSDTLHMPSRYHIPQRNHQMPYSTWTERDPPHRALQH
jgi:hypothetical protein